MLQALQDQLASLGTLVSLDELLETISFGQSPTNPEQFWTLDPIDGTKGFLRNAQWCTALTLIHSYKPSFAVLGCPNLSYQSNETKGDGCVFWAHKNKGAWTQSLSHKQKRKLSKREDICEPGSFCPPQLNLSHT